MNILVVLAHPEPASLCGALKDLTVAELTGAGHHVEISDLYAMRWKAVADGADFLAPRDPERLRYIRESKHAFSGGTQTPDVVAEQAKLLRADAVILHFPLWWFGLPAILKGWVDRVFAYGFAYGIGRYGGGRWGDRYGEGGLAGRRAILAFTAGGRAPQYAPRGVNGAIDDLLFPVEHGMLFYTGMRVLPAFAVYEADRLDAEGWASVAAAWKARLDTLFTADPIPFRLQNGGDYDDRQELLPGLEGDATGLAIHRRPS